MSFKIFFDLNTSQTNLAGPFPEDSPTLPQIDRWEDWGKEYIRKGTRVAYSLSALIVWLGLSFSKQGVVLWLFSERFF